jgi:serine protease Do
MDYEEKTIKAIDSALPSVISIAASKDVKAVQAEIEKMGMDPKQFADRLANESENGKVTISSGSAFVVDASGIVLTNKHVVQEKDASYKAVIDGTSYEIEVVAQDPLADIAIIKIKNPPTNLTAIPLGNSHKVRLGQSVITIGNALGEFQNTVSVGIISGLSRILSATTDMDGHSERLRGLIQTDAAINPGNSGGPMLNIDGEVIGINTAVVVGAQSIGFTIPIDRAKKDLAEIKQYGHIRTPFLGIRYVIVNKRVQAHFHLPIDYGAYVLKENLPDDHAVLPGSAAEIAGIREGDLITKAQGKNVTAAETLEDTLDALNVGDILDLVILREGKELSIKVPLEDRAKFI